LLAEPALGSRISIEEGNVDHQDQDAPRHHAVPDDHAVAREIAEAAGRLLMELRSAHPAGADSKLLRDEGDRRSHDFIMSRLAELRPDDAILSEEGSDDRDRLRYHRVWIVDPLDGTREYGEPPRDDWAVHVALCIDGAPVVGAVALPAQGRVYSTGGTPPALPAPGNPPRVAASRTRAPAIVTDVATAMQAELVYMGSAGAKAMAILNGDVDIYVHAGGQFEWDSAAPVAVALGAGLHCSRIDGTTLTYNHENPYLPDLLICREETAGAVLAAVRAGLEAAARTAEAEGVAAGPETRA
jgi:3'(2'), 5'-bisphosphate nucleotidase